jgi:DNA-binding transcriptional regulator LsrR (DeoR family)
MYYIEDMTQEAIASTLGFSRPKIGRLLTQAKESGVVEISVNLHPSLAVPVESELSSRFGLVRTVLVVDNKDEEQLRMQAGKAAVEVLDAHLHDGAIAAIGMGRNARAVAQQARGLRPRHATIVSAMGGVASIGDGLNSNDVASRLAEAFGADSFGIYAPAYVDSQVTRDALLHNEDVRATVDRARGASVAVVGIGDANEESLVVKLGLLKADEMALMRKEGAVGDVLGSFFDAQGAPVASWIENRVIGICAADLRKIELVIAVAPESTKAESIVGVLNSGIVNVLITSLSTARRVLELSEAI